MVGAVGVRVEEGVEGESIFCDRPAPEHKKSFLTNLKRLKRESCKR
jgi:hypothetical protein